MPRLLSATLVLALLLGLGQLVRAQVVENISVTATVLGSKPVVTSFTPTSGTNDGTTAVTQIVGYNFGTVASDIVGVFLDNPTSTALTGTITLEVECDVNGTDCGDGDGEQYSRITGLSIPSGVAPGTYNILVTTSSGTNVVSDSKFAMSAPSAGATPQIDSVSPSIVSFTEGFGQSADLDITVSHSTDDTLHIDIDDGSFPANISDNGPATTADAAPNGETETLTITDAGAGAQVTTFTIQVGEDDAITGNAITQDVNLFIEPGF